MPRGNILLSNFTGGEVSPRIFSRPNVSQVANGLRCAENAMIALQGGAFKRTGTRFVTNLTDTYRHRFLKFQYSVDETYMIVLGDEKMWFYRDQSIVTGNVQAISGATKANPCVITTGAPHGFSNGDTVLITGIDGMEELNNRLFEIDGVTATTFQLLGVDSTAYETYSSGGVAADVFELATPWSATDIHRVQVTQVNNVMYLVHPSYAPRKITRVTSNSFTIEEVRPLTGPFREINLDDTLTITPSSFSASASIWATYPEGTTCTLTAASDYFTADMVNGYFRLFEPGASTGVPSAPIGTNTAIANGDYYSYAGNVYGINNIGSSPNWEFFTRVPEHESGTVKVYSGGLARSFESTFLHPGFCIVKILSYTSATVVEAEIVQHHMPESIAASGTSFWEEGAWSDERGWPGAICRYEQRLFFSGHLTEPTTIWGSASGVNEDFTDGADDDRAVTYRLSAESGDTVLWLKGRRILTAGTSAGEFIIAASGDNEALTPSNFKAIQQEDIGSSQVLPVTMGQVVIFPEREGRADNLAIRLREYAYQFTRDRFEATDLTVFSEHIFGSGITKLAVSHSPEELIWCLRADGQIAALTYKPAQEAMPWHRHVIGGDSTAVIKEIATMPGIEGDELWCQVNRTVAGETVAYVEVMTKRFREYVDEKADGVFVDASLTYDGAATSTLSGLWHLRGETVSICADGIALEATVDSGGRLTLPGSPALQASKIHVGYPYTFKIETQQIEFASKGMTANSRPQRMSQVWVRVLQSLGGKCGPDAATLKDLDYRIESHPMDTSPPLQDGYIEVDFPGGWDRELTIRIEQSEPLPFYCSALVAEISTSG